MYEISVMPYLDGDKYVKIFTIDKMPKHKLEKYCIIINPPKLSPFTDESKCIIAFKSLAHPTHIMQLNELTDLMHLLHEEPSGYKIDYQLSKLMIKNKDQHNKNVMFYIRER